MEHCASPHLVVDSEWLKALDFYKQAHMHNDLYVLTVSFNVFWDKLPSVK